MKYHFRPRRMTLIKSQTITSTGKEAEKFEYSYIVGRNEQLLLKSLQFLKRLKSYHMTQKFHFKVYIAEK